MRLFLSIAFVLIGSAAFAQNSTNNSLGLALPAAPQSYQSDSFRSGELDCSNAIGSATNLEFGVTGLIRNDDIGFNNIGRGNSRAGDVGVYARIVIPLGGPKERINCNDLYEIELQRKKLEVMRLEAELEELRRLQFEN
jgi:hypothetical protein